MWHHFAPDLGKSTEASCDVNEPLLIHVSDITGDVPSILDRFSGQIFPIGIALHYVGPRDEQHAIFVCVEFIICVRSDHSR